jgi:hypothetical protein
VRPSHLRRRASALSSLTAEDRRVVSTLTRLRFSSEIAIRRPALRLDEPLRGAAISDRRPPPAEEGAPLRRLVRSRGVALQLELLLLAWAQGPASDPARLPPMDAPTEDVDLVELIALPAVAATTGRQSAQAADKRARSLRQALALLCDEGLVELEDAPRPFTRPMTLLREVDDPPGRARPQQYAPPTEGVATIGLPAEFFTNGWHYCLDPSEILTYLLVRDICGRGGDHITADARLRSYAINKDMLLRTKVLERAGVISVERDERQRPDGTVEDFDDGGGRPILQRWRLLDEGLKRPAHGALTEGIQGILTGP